MTPDERPRTDLPGLERALVDAAARRAQRPARIAGTTLLAAVAAAVVAVAVAAGGSRREVPATTAQPAESAIRTGQQAAEAFAALRDQTNLVEPPRAFVTFTERRATAANTHEVRPGVLVAALTDRVCVYVETSGGGGCEGGDGITDLAAGRTPPFQSAFRGRQTVAMLVPDGTRDARLTESDGSETPVPIRDNWLTVRTERPRALTWVAPDGSVRRFALDQELHTVKARRLALRQRLRLGRPAPAQTVATLDGGRVSIADLPGKVLVTFGGSWCGPCRTELPRLGRLQLRAGSAVYVRSQDTRAAFELPLSTDVVALDRSGAYADAWHVNAFPTSLLVADGRIVARREGPATRRWLDRALRAG